MKLGPQDSRICALGVLVELVVLGALGVLSRRYEKTHRFFDLSGQKTYFPIVVACLDGLGRLGEAEKLYASMCDEFFRRTSMKSQENHQNHFFDFLTLVIRHRFFFFVPETLNPFFLKIQKDAHREMDRNPRRQKLIWSHMVPFGVKSDPSFEPKNKEFELEFRLLVPPGQ